MSATNPIEGAANGNNITPTARENAELNKTEFLSLLVAQLENQDPMNPVDNQDFIAQLATFSQLEQVISVNEGMARLEEQMTANAQLNYVMLGSIYEQMARIADAVAPAGAETAQ